MKLYGNKYFTDTVQSMLKSGRLAHCFIIFGEKGVGKKTAAGYLAKALVCTGEEERPCGKCRACRLAEENAHPDIIFPETAGKLNTYNIETVREVRSGAYVKPNDGNAKVYIFRDADNIKLPAQNALLKIIEEPPEFAYFIFTASSKSAFLPTILSRAVSLGITPCSIDQCSAALGERGYSSEQILAAQSCFGGNIGMCISFLENDNLQNIASLTKKAVNSIINRDEYSLLAALSSPEIKDRETVRLFLEMLDKAIRDAAVMRVNPDAEAAGCCKRESSRLAPLITASSAERMHSLIYRASLDAEANVSTFLLMSALCGGIMNS